MQSRSDGLRAARSSICIGLSIIIQSTLPTQRPIRKLFFSIYFRPKEIASHIFFPISAHSYILSLSARRRALRSREDVLCSKHSRDLAALQAELHSTRATAVEQRRYVARHGARTNVPKTVFQTVFLEIKASSNRIEGSSLWRY